MRFTALIVAITSFFSCKAQTKPAALTTSKDDNTLLWEVSGGGLSKPSYLFGTFHLMCKNDINFSEQLKTAVSGADKMYMELDMDDPSVMMGGLLMMNMKNGKKLADLYSEADYNRVKMFFNDSLHMQMGFVEHMKPFMLVAMLYPKMMPCKTVSGVEEELMKLAKIQQKEIRGLETMEQQTAIFDSIPYEEQAKELLKSIDSLQDNRKYFDTMLRVYKSQRLKDIEAMFSKSEFGMQEHEDVLLYDRNRNWVTQLKDIMKKESVFVAVGAGHLVGEKGLVALLRKAGYKIRPILNK